jgi:hypothetical protein
VYGELLASWCRADELEWMMSAPYGEFKARRKSLMRRANDRKKAAEKKEK